MGSLYVSLFKWTITSQRFLHCYDCIPLSPAQCRLMLPTLAHPLLCSCQLQDLAYITNPLIYNPSFAAHLKLVLFKCGLHHLFFPLSPLKLVQSNMVEGENDSLQVKTGYIIFLCTVCRNRLHSRHIILICGLLWDCTVKLYNVLLLYWFHSKQDPKTSNIILFLVMILYDVDTIPTCSSEKKKDDDSAL